MIVSPYLDHAFHPGGLPVLVWRTEMFSNDPLGLVIPTEVTKVGGTHFVSTSSHFTAGIVEGGEVLRLTADRHRLPERTQALARPRE